MKKTLIGLLALAVCGAAWAQQDTTLTERELRDPKQLRPWLLANAADAESRIADLEAGTIAGNLDVGDSATIATNLTVGGTIDIGPTNDTTIARASAGVISVEGKNVYMVGGADVAVTDGGTGLSGGTSGGVPYFSATTTMASSALLAQYGIVLGGGAGTAPATLAPSANSGAPLLSAGSAANPAYGPLNLAGGATIVTGTLPVADGGTGAATLTANGVLLGNATGAIAATAAGTDNQVLCGVTSGAPTFRALTDADIPDTITASNYALLTQVAAAPSGSAAPNVLENVVTITAKNLAGGTLAERRLIRVWTSETEFGAASTNNIVSLVLSTGVAVDTVVEHADYRYVTAAAGTAVATITGTAAGTNYLMMADGSAVGAVAVVFAE